MISEQSQFSILKVKNDEYLLVMVNIPRKSYEKIEKGYFEGVRISNNVSSRDYAVFNIYGIQAEKATEEIEQYLKMKFNK